MSEFEERADQLALDIIDTSLVDGEMFRSARRKLLATGAKLLVGPRGTGKTHLMRYTYQHALDKPTAPLVLYASFNRYLNLEPLLKRSPDALKRFHSWVLAKLILSCFQWLEDKGENSAWFAALDPLYDSAKLSGLISLLERGGGDDIYQEFGQFLTVDLVLKAARALASRFSRSRTVFLLDDAALSLSDQYLVSFFEIFRLLKTQYISPKASVYPGTTQYGPTFHASHEAESVPLWLSIEDSEYSQIMGEIAEKRLTKKEVETINRDILEVFKYASFGIPRTFLRLLREYFDSRPGTSQQKINKIIEQQASLIGAEYDSLGLKIRQFSSLVSMGRRLFDKAVIDISAGQSEDTSTRNIVLGIRQDSGQNPLAERMLRFLIEVGMLFPLQAVSHGPNRKYDRYIPHIAFLYQHGAFREGRGSSLKVLPQVMQRPAAKHPVRRDLNSLLGAETVENLHLDLPPCQNCGAERLNDSQRFCHNCGQELVAASLFEECMKLPLEQVPGISKALIQRIQADTNLRTIGHVYASQNASGDLQQANYVGPVRASGIISKVSVMVNEFLS
ncbi:hypothetical protein CNE_BB2p01710 (plasmid) [Cupriavidus necator N-1]|uniref:Zinc ribbon domain-containing protein n=1 Tax=Cupriavidus necator (strain ATCC 43291 / DSM 13513 / CCUG 52238 / LMG 8453 / N-1) TaxID=1042878 RepID=F8GYP1_CUPNN|nr:hypothetical protein [Cupriavidus necator]AEI82982.1 hypothetical protein CNE_BB2p01710 [Cupriavidus necator N-1]MDX6008768.1 hypothetical protein [Cupriavidus necator]